jgi:hypothetical protein
MCVVMSADLNWVRSEISYVVSDFSAKSITTNCDTRSLCEKSQVCGSLVSVAQSPLASFPNTGAGEGYVRERAGDHRFVADSEWDWTLRVFDHVDLNTSDYTASARFYETVLSPLGIPKIAEHEQGTCFTNLNVVDRRPPTSNLHLCFYARSKEQVDAFHRAGIEAGYRSNGAPGYRD